MPVAAVPAYLGKDFQTASPGMRFGLFLELWGVNTRTGKHLWGTHDVNYRPSGRHREVRSFNDEQKTHAIKNACNLSEDDRLLMEAAEARQQAIASKIPETDIIKKTATSVAPFTTGLGNEHPLENGFSFLNPYGLPYLPGSGVKGVVRHAARELASGEWGASHGWNDERRYSPRSDRDNANRLCLVDVLFGREVTSGENKQFRGLLTFWDVIPQIHGLQLAVDVMTPHQTHYFQKGEAPHDSGSPNPISFLTVPPRSKFTFHVSCDTSRLQRVAALDPSLILDPAWKTLLDAAFAHAFQWLGFGAKTAVGYGAMESVPVVAAPLEGDAVRMAEKQRADAEKARADRIAAEEKARRQAEFEALPEFRKRIVTLKQARDAFLVGSRSRDEYDKVQRCANSLLDVTLGCPDSAAREEGAALIEAVYDKIGWHRPGANTRQKRRQKNKKQEGIRRIRTG